MTAYDKQLNQNYQIHLKHLKLKGLRVDVATRPAVT